MWEVAKTGFAGLRFTAAGRWLTRHIFQCRKADFELRMGQKTFK